MRDEVVRHAPMLDMPVHRASLNDFAVHNLAVDGPAVDSLAMRPALRSCRAVSMDDAPMRGRCVLAALRGRCGRLRRGSCLRDGNQHRTKQRNGAAP